MKEHKELGKHNSVFYGNIAGNKGTGKTVS